MRAMSRQPRYVGGIRRDRSNPTQQTSLVIEIRPATPDDVAVVQDIEVDAGRRFVDIGFTVIAEDDPPSADDLLPAIADGRIWVAEDAGVAVGYVMVSIVDGHGHVDQVSVRVAAAGRGVGRALLDRAHGWAAGLGLEAMSLTTFTEVAFNGPYYGRLGYVNVPPGELGPELRAIRAAETAAGLDVSPRSAMQRPLP